MRDHLPDAIYEAQEQMHQVAAHWAKQAEESQKRIDEVGEEAFVESIIDNWDDAIKHSGMYATKLDRVAAQAIINQFRLKGKEETVVSEKPFVAVVKFPSTYKEYDFNCNINVKPGDKVIVRCSTGLQEAKVVATKSCSSKVKGHAWVLSKVDPLAAHEACCKGKRIEELKEKKQLLLNKLHDRTTRLGKVDLYNILRKYDGEIEDLMDAYDCVAGELRYLISGGK